MAMAMRITVTAAERPGDGIASTGRSASCLAPETLHAREIPSLRPVEGRQLIEGSVPPNPARGIHPHHAQGLVALLTG